VDIQEDDLHSHLKARMLQRGITRQELEDTINAGWSAEDAKPGTLGKVMVFAYNRDWSGKFYEEKEVTVYYKNIGERVVLLAGRDAENIDPKEAIGLAIKAANGLDVLFMAYAKAENLHSDPDKAYGDLRTYWGQHAYAFTREVLRDHS